MTVQKKMLTRVRLINWHYFRDEMMSMNGSVLVSGDNTTGKSTLMDAIQLVLTTNTRRFNAAANEKGTRNLRGYVRCKVGNVGETYLRKNTVISNVALEFFEEKTNQYFVLGVHMTSADEESRVITRWYVEECRLEQLSFTLTEKEDGVARPAMADEFRRNGVKIKYIEQLNGARDRFKRRMGNLEDRFFEIIPKSLAFKPMDNVKDFINKFVLTENSINVETLRINIETLSELEEVIDKSNRKLAILSQIMEKYEEFCKKKKDLLINQMLIGQAEIDSLSEEIAQLNTEIAEKTQYIQVNQGEISRSDDKIKENDEKLLSLKISKENNEASKMINEIQGRIDRLEQEIQRQVVTKSNLDNSVKKLKLLLQILHKEGITIITPEEVGILAGISSPGEKVPLMQKLAQQFEAEDERFREEQASLSISIKELSGKIEGCKKKLEALNKKKLDYPWYTVRLKEAIEGEFQKRGIRGRVYILADLLEVTDPKWHNAVEGYLNTQKFNLVVEPDLYDIALEVYHKEQKKIHTVGLINTKKLKIEQTVDNQSLAYVVHSRSQYAKAYANYVLGRVMRCKSIHDLENHKIAITSDCMLYQGYVARNIDQAIYNNPFIGQDAFKKQIENVTAEMEELSGERKGKRDRHTAVADILEAGKAFIPELVSTYLDAPYYLDKCEKELKEAGRELSEANNDPTFIEILDKIAKCEAENEAEKKKNSGLQKENGRLEGQIIEREKARNNKQTILTGLNKSFEGEIEKHGAEYKEAAEKYAVNRKTKSPRTIVNNFTPQETQIKNDRDRILNGQGGLISLQYDFNHRFDQDYLQGTEGILEYAEAKRKLESVELVRFEEDLKKAKKECEMVFKTDFLAKLKENIDNARTEFRNLNKALENIYYGDDSYHFTVTYDKKKESLYRMITSENNMEGYNLWTEAFEREYKEEMDDLFDKLITKDDGGEQVIEEYTDYRSYLDYDIKILKRNGIEQRFSDIYGEKSGSETQVPYYVAIAASFYQLYRLGNTVRIMLLDEAFDKMDDDRITSMLSFFQELGLQVILATPPPKIEIIGEAVDTILTAIRIGNNSIVEEYSL